MYVVYFVVPNESFEHLCLAQLLRHLGLPPHSQSVRVRKRSSHLAHWDCKLARLEVKHRILGSKFSSAWALELFGSPLLFGSDGSAIWIFRPLHINLMWRNVCSIFSTFQQIILKISFWLYVFCFYSLPFLLVRVWGQDLGSATLPTSRLSLTAWDWLPQRCSRATPWLSLAVLQ